MPPPLPLAGRAGFFERGIAAGIDVCLVAIPAAILRTLLGAGLVAAGVESLVARWGADLFALLLPLAYTFYFETFRAATPGKMFRGLVIARNDGAAADRWSLAFRWMTRHYGRIWLLVGTAIILVLPGAGTLAGLFSSFVSAVLTIGLLQALDEDRLTWHDQWTGTAVWKKPKAAPAWQRPTPRWLPREPGAANNFLPLPGTPGRGQG